jgi:L-threonylcarbamoyladenylate synthase
MSPSAIKRLSKAIENAAVIAYPTDTIWGLGCHPLSETAAYRILEIKQRSPEKGLILLSNDLAYCQPYLDDSLSQQQLSKLAKPDSKPVTWLVPADPLCPFWLRGHHTTIAIRLTNHPLVSQICNAIQAPIVSTSANRQGKDPVRSILQLRREFGDELDFIVSGYSTGTGLPSEIKSLGTGHVIRKS